MGQQLTKQKKCSRMEKCTAFCICDGCGPYERTVIIPKVKIPSIECSKCKCSNKSEWLSNGIIKIHINKSCSKMEEGRNLNKKKGRRFKKKKFTAFCICDDCKIAVEKTVMIPKMEIASIECRGCKRSNKPYMLSNGGSLWIDCI